MSKTRKIAASRSSMRADAGRPRLTARLSSADMAMTPPTASTGRVKPSPQWTTAAVKAWPVTAAQRISTSARRRTPPRGGRPGLAERARSRSRRARRWSYSSSIRCLRFTVVNSGMRALLRAVGRLLGQASDLAQDQAGDRRQRQLARLVEPHPADVAHLAGMADLAGRVLGARHEEAGVEAARPAGRRHGAGDQVEAIERRRQPLVEEALPVLAVVLLGRAAVQGLGEQQPGLLEGLADGGDGERPRPLRRWRRAAGVRRRRDRAGWPPGCGRRPDRPGRRGRHSGWA